ncbi:macrophage mannose receptor 1-like [Xiphophorus couchianus]|uniref:macrophage mannose receptor 1-like n=1 Tax=Xiphophorus couchianus TaxID=32473 RepID=UPI001016B9A7|nr:macrophage mannose receptor 1-like [Xiphophorus couchianus]
MQIVCPRFCIFRLKVGIWISAVRLETSESAEMEKILWFFAAVSALSSVSSERHYHFIYEPKNWTDARSYCRETYTDLVTVDNQDVVTILNNMADPQQMDSTTVAWIGLYHDEIRWKWLSGGFYQSEELNFQNWEWSEPNLPWYMPSCGVMDSSGMWYDALCENNNYPVCSNGSEEETGVFFVDAGMSWEEAQSYCREHYTDLAFPTNQSENLYIESWIPKSKYGWIGLYLDTWKWSDGHMYGFQHWAEGKPDVETVPCSVATFGSSGAWVDWTCDEMKPFICHHDSPSFTTQVVKVKLVGNSALDLNDPAVLENMKKELQQQLKQQSVDADVKLSWKKQQDGKIFHQEEETDLQ